MNPEDYVSYPIALALKKAGLDEPCRYYYNPKGMLRKAKDNALSPEVLNNRCLDEITESLKARKGRAAVTAPLPCNFKTLSI